MRAYDQGRAAYDAGLPRVDNPHDPGTLDEDDWDRGWWDVHWPNHYRQSLEAAAPLCTKCTKNKKEPMPHPNLIALLEDAFDALESTADSDISHFEDEEDERECAPAQYAARKIREAIAMLGGRE